MSTTILSQLFLGVKLSELMTIEVVDTSWEKHDIKTGKPTGEKIKETKTCFSGEIKGVQKKLYVEAYEYLSDLFEILELPFEKSKSNAAKELRKQFLEKYQK